MSSIGSPDDPASWYSHICNVLNAGLADLGNFKCTNGSVHKKNKEVEDYIILLQQHGMTVP